MSLNVVRLGVHQFATHHRATIWFPKPRDRVFDYRSIEAFCKKFMEDNGGELLGFDCQHLQFAFTMLKYENVVVAWQTKEIMKKSLSQTHCLIWRSIESRVRTRLVSHCGPPIPIPSTVTAIRPAVR